MQFKIHGLYEIFLFDCFTEKRGDVLRLLSGCTNAQLTSLSCPIYYYPATLVQSLQSEINSLLPGRIQQKSLPRVCSTEINIGDRFAYVQLRVNANSCTLGSNASYSLNFRSFDSPFDSLILFLALEVCKIFD